MKSQILVIAAALSVSAIAAVQPGESLIGNGQLRHGESGTPTFWMNEAGDNLSWSEDGGPDGLPSVKLSGRGTLRQYGLRLVSNETYRISGLIRSKEAPSAQLVVCNHRWWKSVGIKNIKPTQDWTRMTKEFKAPESDGLYFLAIGTGSGEVEMADIKLEAVSEGALAGSGLPEHVERFRAPRLVPWQTRLHRIPSDNKQLKLHYFGKLSGDVEDYEIVWSVDGAAARRQPLKKGLNTLKLRDIAKGDHKLAAAIERKGDKQPVFSDNFDLSIVDIPKVSTSGHRRLNNLVTEVLSTKLKATDAAQTFEFCNPREGWVFIAVRDWADGAEVAVDGATVIDAQSLLRGETFRLLPMGAHKVTVKGVANGGRLIVRSVVDIFNYCPGYDNPAQVNGKYDWDFMVKNMLPCVTTLNGGRIPGSRNIDLVHKSGYQWLGNILPFKERESTDEMVKRFNSSHVLNKPWYDGATLDEFYFGNPALYIKFFGNLERINVNDRLLYTWMISQPQLPSVDHWVISKAINVSHGRGKILSEVYCDSKPTEAEHRAYLQKKVVEPMKVYRKFYPGVEESLGIIFSPCSQLTVATHWGHANVDFKYCLDAQLNIVANDPAFEGLGCTGYWGTYYADRETNLWILKLLRHYCVEGEKGMLSERYGLCFAPGHITNGDFDDGFDNWTVKGDVQVEKHNRFAAKYQYRGGDIRGQNVAVFRKTADETSAVKQTVKGLKPGRMYALKFCALDLADAELQRKEPKRKFAGRRYGVDARFGDGVKVAEELSWVHIEGDTRKPGELRANLHHVVFTATKPETTLTIDNAAAKPGEAIAVNFVSLLPYVPEEK